MWQTEGRLRFVNRVSCRQVIGWVVIALRRTVAEPSPVESDAKCTLLGRDTRDALVIDGKVQIVRLQT